MKFGDTTTPSSKWWDGTPSGLDIVAITAPALVMTVKTNGVGPTLMVNNLGYVAGGWRVPQHPRLMADTTGDGRADVVGFGNAGVYVSRAQADGSFGPAQLVVSNFGFDAGGWRVPSTLAPLPKPAAAAPTSSGSVTRACTSTAGDARGSPELGRRRTGELGGSGDAVAPTASVNVDL